MLALAFLTITAAAEHAQPPPPGMIPLTRHEIARLLTDPARPPRRHRVPAALVSLAQASPAHRPQLPLPAASSPDP
jgi:hypothetical protein